MPRDRHPEDSEEIIRRSSVPCLKRHCWGAAEYAVHCHRYVELAPEDRSVVLTYSRYGETARLEIPLPERGETA